MPQGEVRASTLSILSLSKDVFQKTSPCVLGLICAYILPPAVYVAQMPVTVT